MTSFSCSHLHILKELTFKNFDWLLITVYSSVCWGLQINKVCCIKWKTPPPPHPPPHHHWQKNFPQYKIIRTTTGSWKLIFETNEDWFFLLEIYFCDYIFSKFIHTFIIIISCPCDFCGCCLKMHICLSFLCFKYIEGLYILISVNCNKEFWRLSPD